MLRVLGVLLKEMKMVCWFLDLLKRALRDESVKHLPRMQNRQESMCRPSGTIKSHGPLAPKEWADARVGMTI